MCARQGETFQIKIKYLAIVVHVVVLQSTAKKCTKNYNARAEQLFCSLNLLFSDVPVAVAVVGLLLNSLLSCTELKRLTIGKKIYFFLSVSLISDFPENIA